MAFDIRVLMYLQRNASVGMSFVKWDNAGNDSCPKANIPLKMRNDLKFYFISFLCFFTMKICQLVLFYLTYYFQFFKHLLDFYSEQIIVLVIICCSVAQLGPTVRIFVTPWTAAHQASLSFNVS